MKVQLVHCPEKPTGMVEGSWYPPLNLLSLATYLRKHSACEVEILDGQILTAEEIAQRINANIVGFDLMHSSIESFDFLSKIAKTKGATTIVGGHLATHLAEEILRENPNMDYVCRLGGEEALLGIVNGQSHPNLAYRKFNGDIHVPKWCDLKPIKLGEMPIPDRKIPGIDVERYISNFNADLANSKLKLPYHRAVNTYFSRGCPYRIHGHGCSFCSRSDTIMAHRSPEQIWNEAKYLVENFGEVCLVDFSDSADPFLRPLTEYIEKYDRPWKYLRIYAAVNEIAHRGVIPLLKKLGVITVLLGIESADEEVLRQNVAPQKLHTPERVLSVCKSLADAGIMVSPAYVLGMKGENKSSLLKTLNLNRDLQAIGNTEITYSNIITPFPGAKAFDDLLAIPRARQRFGRTYHLKTEEMERAYIENFTTVSWKQLQEARIELAKDSPVYSFEFVTPEK